MPVMQIASGLHRVGSDTVNSYLVVDSGGVTVIDAGLPGLHGLAAENLQARIRGMVLMTLSNAEGHLVLTTGNKS